jgi:hypothetical protein
MSKQEKQWLEAKEAVPLFSEVTGLVGRSFFRYKERVRQQLPPGKKKGALYLRSDIEKLSPSRTKGQTKTKGEEQQPSITVATDWIREGDLPYVLALDFEMYGPEGTVDPKITYRWWQRNPYMCRILFDAQDRRNVLGAITIMPLEMDTILKLLRREIQEQDILPEAILTYEPGEYDAFVLSTVVRPQARIHLRQLLYSLVQFWCDQYPQVRLRRLYTFPWSREGWLLIKHLYFAPRRDLAPDAFELDPWEPNPSRLIQEFQRCIEQKRANEKGKSPGEQ